VSGSGFGFALLSLFVRQCGSIIGLSVYLCIEPCLQRHL
jgi:hypothetical protein